MARLPALVKSYAELDGRDPKTIDHIARVIREAGKLPTGKRGMGAEHMGEAHAVNLIIAANGADSGKDGPLAIDRFRSLLAQPSAATYPDQDAISQILSKRSFGEALESLIRLAPFVDKQLESLTGNAYFDLPREVYFDLPRETRRGMQELACGIEVRLGKYFGEIEFWHQDGDKRIIDASTLYIVDSEKFFVGFYGKLPNYRKNTVTLKFPIFRELAALLFDRPDADQTHLGEPSGDPAAAR